MKKTIGILLAVLLSLSMVIPVLADEPETLNSTEVTYEVEVGYEWEVPSKTEFTDVQTNTELDGKVSVSKCMLTDKTYLAINIGDATMVNDFKLKDQDNLKITLDYEVVKKVGDSPLQNGDEVLAIPAGQPADKDGNLTTPVSQKLTAKINTIPSFAGLYKDTITFVASIKDLNNLTGWTWTANDVVDSLALRNLYGGNYNMFINFTSNGYNMTFLREQDTDANIRYQQNNSTFWTVYHGGNPGNWSAPEWKTIQFTGDVDSRHSIDIHDGFINWLFLNGTFQAR